MCVPMCTPVYCETVPLRIPCTPVKNSSPQKSPPTIFELRRAPARDTNLRRLPSSKHSAREGGLPAAPLILGVWGLTRFSGGTGAFWGRARGAMRGRDGITSQKTVRKPFEEKAASVDVAALTALLRILECTGYNTKTEKIISRAFFLRRFGKTAKKNAFRKRVALNEKKILQVRNKYT